MIPTAPLPQPQVATPLPAVGRPPSNATALRNGRDPLTNNVPSITFSDATARPLGPMGEMEVTTKGPLEPTLKPPTLNATPFNPVPMRPALVPPITAISLPRPAPITPLPKPKLLTPTLVTPLLISPPLPKYPLRPPAAVLNVYSQVLSNYLGNGGVVNGLSLGSLGANNLGLGFGNAGLTVSEANNIGLNGLGIGNIGFGLGNAGLAVSGLNTGLGVAGLGYGAGLGVQNVAATSQVPVTGPFTASGNAELVVGGDFGVGGQAVIGGQIPVLGAVGFSGQIPASGVVSIAGNCGCSSYPL
ncbi:unnamed protein product [Diatraea saccharalis]|uniref:Uncharacterized protein n=1 Tax=Diatraea saccharalis TaxID=40085 RepID=A0A9N9WK82_9NEOP|nr:unnamed protein product [Diatraea saccharalis]